MGGVLAVGGVGCRRVWLGAVWRAGAAQSLQREQFVVDWCSMGKCSALWCSAGQPSAVHSSAVLQHAEERCTHGATWRTAWQHLWHMSAAPASRPAARCTPPSWHAVKGMLSQHYTAAHAACHGLGERSCPMRACPHLWGPQSWPESASATHCLCLTPAQRCQASAPGTCTPG